MEIIRQLLINAGGTAIAGVSIAVALSLVQVSKIQINPWDAIRKWIGGKLSAEQIADITTLKADVKKLGAKLDEYIRRDDERTADEWRHKILAFNNQLLRDIPHTKEDFVEILEIIDQYEGYCDANSEYRNSRAVHAIKNINDSYDKRLRDHNFLKG